MAESFEKYGETKKDNPSRIEVDQSNQQNNW